MSDIVPADGGDIEPSEMTEEQLAGLLLRITSVYPGEWPKARQVPYAERLALYPHSVAIAAIREMEEHYRFPSVKDLVHCLAWQAELAKARAIEARGETLTNMFGREETVESVVAMRELTRPRGK